MGGAAFLAGRTSSSFEGLGLGGGLPTLTPLEGLDTGGGAGIAFLRNAFSPAFFCFACCLFFFSSSEISFGFVIALAPSNEIVSVLFFIFFDILCFS